MPCILSPPSLTLRFRQNTRPYGYAGVGERHSFADATSFRVRLHGLGRFFSSIQNQAVPGLCFINISLLHIESRQSYPLVAEQLIKKKVQETAPKSVKNKGKPGRPIGSKNKNRREVVLSAFQLQLQECIRQALVLIGSTLKIGHFVYDGALGNNAGLQAVKPAILNLNKFNNLCLSMA